MRWHAPDWGWPGRGVARGRERHRDRIVDLLRRVQMPDPEAALERYPHQFSGGQRQRLLIAAALACSPALVIADEPTTALDVTTQQQILDLLRDLVEEFGLSMLFVTHDLGVVAQLCDDLCVIYAGQTVERGRTARHPHAAASSLYAGPARLPSRPCRRRSPAFPAPCRRRCAPGRAAVSPRAAERRVRAVRRAARISSAAAAGRLVDCVLHERLEVLAHDRHAAPRIARCDGAARR